MESIDPALAARVWQRVRGQTPATEGLRELLTCELTDAAMYLALSRRFQGRNRELLLQMHRQEENHAACLRGIYLLLNGARPQITVPEPENLPLPMALRRCYSRELSAIAQYEARMTDAEYGKIFAGMAAQEHDHCRCILELLGNLHADPVAPSSR